MFIFKTVLATGIISALMSSANAQVKPDILAANPSALEQKAQKIYQRLTGTKLPIDSPAIKQMAGLLEKGNLEGAAQIATADPDFLNITVKIMALEMSTREETIKTPLNDFTASFIGVTRDQTDARELLTGNFYYRGSAADVNIIDDVLLSNNHYAALETNRVNLAQDLIRVEGQVIADTATTTKPNPDPAGVLTSRGFMGAHALMGTNRRLVEYTFREFMCVPLEKWADTGASDARIGRDIDRFPSADHNKFLTSCKGCHTVMDGFRGAFAKWEFQGRGLKHSDVNVRGNGNTNNFNIRADAQGVVAKMNQNSTMFPAGYVMTNDSFLNHAVRPANAALFEWRGESAGGNGVRGFGTVVANSRRFSQCMAQRVFKAVCRKEVDPVRQKEALKKWGDEFEASGYKLKKLFETVAVKPECLGN